MSRDNHDPAPVGFHSLHPQTCKLQSEDRFRFTPTKTSRTVPRVWERKPSTSFKARGKSRKVWKRFRTSFNSMKALGQLIAAEQDGIEDELQTEINAFKNKEFLRGIKKRCLVFGEDEMDRGRSFLETKWESEMGGRRRKLPVEYRLGGSETMDLDDREADSQNDAIGHDTELHSSTLKDVQKAVFIDESVCAEETPTESANPDTLHVSEGLGDEINESINTDEDSSVAYTTAEKVDNVSQVMTDSPTESDERVHTENVKNTAPTDTVEDLTAEQESTLVRSALRSSLDGEDAELLNNFLSKAKAKRAAKAAMNAQSAEETNAIVQEEMVDLGTPRRRALEELDTNSPSPQKPQLSPCKPENPAPALGEMTNKEDEQAADQQQTASPVGRRSSRLRPSRLPPLRTASAPAVRNTLSLRRAKGTEFVFLQRTEAQELALATRKNTRKNKGDSLLPKYILPTLALQIEDDTPSKATKRAGKKSVTWNEKRLVEYEGGEDPKEPSNDVAESPEKPTKQRADKKKASTSRNTRSQGLQKPSKGDTTTDTESPTASTTAPATATPKARRMRRLGASGSNSSSAAAIDSNTSSSVNPTSPASSRKKLTPKSPGSGLFTMPAKSVSTTSKSSVSGSGRSTTRSGKSKSILQASAGSTPMPRRVRSRG